MMFESDFVFGRDIICFVGPETKLNIEVHIY